MGSSKKSTTPCKIAHEAKVFSKDAKCQCLVNLLDKKSETLAVPLRQRIAEGKSITCKGHLFDVDTLKEALRVWMAPFLCCGILVRIAATGDDTHSDRAVVQNVDDVTGQLRIIRLRQKTLSLDPSEVLDSWRLIYVGPAGLQPSNSETHVVDVGTAVIEQVFSSANESVAGVVERDIFVQLYLMALPEKVSDDVLARCQSVDVLHWIDGEGNRMDSELQGYARRDILENMTRLRELKSISDGKSLLYMLSLMIADKNGCCRIEPHKGRRKALRLIQNGASLAVRSGDLGGCTAIHLASSLPGCCGPESGCTCMSTIVEHLLKHRANIADRTESGCTPLHMAAHEGKGCEATVEYLVNYRADPNAVLFDGAVSVLHLAANSGSAKSIQLLLEGRARMDVQDSKGMIPLHYAACKGHAEILSMLLRRGTAVNVSTYMGHIALHYAAHHGHQEAVKCLIEFRATIDHKHRDLLSPRSTARQAGHSSLALQMSLISDESMFPKMCVTDLKDEGNNCFRAKECERAAKYYEAALMQTSDTAIVAVLHANRSQCFLNLQLYSAAIEEASMCINLNSLHQKALYRRALAFEALNQDDEALIDLDQVLAFNPSHEETLTAHHRLELKKDAIQKEAKLYSKKPFDHRIPLHLKWADCLGERRYQWYVACYRLRLLDDFTWRRPNADGIYELELAKQGAIEAIASFRAFCQMAVAKKVLPPSWDWGKCIDVACSMISIEFDLSEAQRMFCHENPLKFLRATSSIIYGGSSQSISSIDALGKAARNQAGRDYRVDDYETTESTVTSDMPGDALPVLPSYDEIGGFKLWHLGTMCGFSVTAHLNAKRNKCGCKDCAMDMMPTCANCGCTGGKHGGRAGSMGGVEVKCSACHSHGLTTRYCGKQCQLEDWKFGHRSICPGGEKRAGNHIKSGSQRCLKGITHAQDRHSKPDSAMDTVNVCMPDFRVGPIQDAHGVRDEVDGKDATGSESGDEGLENDCIDDIENSEACTTQ